MGRLHTRDFLSEPLPGCLQSIRPSNGNRRQMDHSFEKFVLDFTGCLLSSRMYEPENPSAGTGILESETFQT
jgi:hypothetical protein